MSLSTPGLLWALLPPLAILLVGAWIRRKRLGRLDEFLHSEVDAGFWPAAPQGHLRGPQEVIRTGLLALAVTTLVAALAGVMFGTREIQTYRSSKPVVLVVDISRSMSVDDVPRGRLASARLLIRRVAARIPGAPLGLTVFSGTTHHLLPPGPDREILFNYLESIGPDLVVSQDTDLETALAECAGIAREKEGSGPPLFLLFSDGESPSDFESLAALAESIEGAGGKLSTIALGTREGGEVPLPASGPGLFPQEPIWPGTDAAQAPYSRANPDLLYRLAERGGGRSAAAQNASEVAALLDWVENQVPVGEEADSTLEGIDRWRWLAVLAAVALLLEASLPGPFSRPEEVQWA